MWRQDKFSQNRPIAVLPYKWASDDEKSVLSDRYVQNGSFLKMDNVTLGYSFANLLRGAKYGGISGRIYASVTNVFTITKYKGLDPEVNTTAYGVDYEIYPRSRSFMLGLNLNF
jgi:iron complex outermembrane receptor protein